MASDSGLQNGGDVSPSASRSNPNSGNEAAQERSLSRIQRIAYPYRGALWLLLAELISSLMALMTRYLETSLPDGKRLHPLMVIYWRMSIGFAACLAWGWWRGIPDFPLGRKDLRPLLWVRALGGFVGILGFYYSLTALPLPDATVIFLLVPTLVGIACAIVPALREPFTWIERVSALVSLVGVVLIARPSFIYLPFSSTGSQNNGSSNGDDVPEAAPELKRAVAVVAALIGICGASIAYTCIRWLGKRTHPLIPVTYFSGFGAIVSTFCLVTIPALPNLSLPSSVLELAMILGLGFGGFIMQWALTRGLQLEKGGRGAQIIYIQLVFALTWELIVWGDFPTGSSLVGISLIIVSLTLVNVYKEDQLDGDTGDQRPDEERALLSEARE